MPNIVHRIGIEGATPALVYRSVATREGVASWWTESVIGESAVGSVLQMMFGNDGPAFEVIELTPPSSVIWKCVKGPDKWIDTFIHFEISDANGETVLLFKHSGWKEEVEFMSHCSTQWAYFLIGIKQLFELGQGQPYGPGFKPISRWSQ